MRFQKNFEGESRTLQSFADDTDINKIVGKYRRGGFNIDVNLHRAVYGDFSNVPDYMAAKNSILAAQATFDALPARVRARVNNDPQQLIDFVADSANDEELLELGLVNPILEKDEVPPELLKAPADVPPVTPPGEVSAVQGGE